jgi:hypothetical protein
MQGVGKLKQIVAKAPKLLGAIPTPRSMRDIDIDVELNSVQYPGCVPRL